MKFQQLKRADLSAVIQIINRNYSKSYVSIARRDIQAMFSGKWLKPEYIVAYEDKQIIGFGGYIESWMDDDVCEIMWINVHPRYQRRGVGIRIVEELIKKAKQKKYLMALLSTTVPKFYYHLGFKTLCKTPKAKYVLMSLALKQNKSIHY